VLRRHWTNWSVITEISATSILSYTLIFAL